MLRPLLTAALGHDPFDGVVGAGVPRGCGRVVALGDSDLEAIAHRFDELDDQAWWRAFFRRVEDGTIKLYDFGVDDPERLAGPFVHLCRSIGQLLSDAVAQGGEVIVGWWP